MPADTRHLRIHAGNDRRDQRRARRFDIFEGVNRRD